MCLLQSSVDFTTSTRPTVEAVAANLTALNASLGRDVLGAMANLSALLGAGAAAGGGRLVREGP